MQETIHIAIGTGVLCGVMLVVYLILGKLTGSVALGALTGFIAAVGNFFLMAMNVQKVTTDLDPEDPDSMKRAKTRMKLSYNQRLLGMAALIVASGLLLKASWVTSMLPLIFPRITIMVMNVLNKRKPKGSEY